MKQVKLKLCGNHSFHDLKTTINSRADYIGVVFASSKRKVEKNELKKWLEQITFKFEQKLVGIFVNEEPEVIRDILSIVPLDIIQAHGNETVDDLLKIKESCHLPIWKAIHHGPNALEKMKAYEGIVSGYVIDSKRKGKWGGTGERFNWDNVPTYINEARRQNTLCLIAGGITPENVDEILTYDLDGIDLSSGIETNGQKDSKKIKQLEERLMNYEYTIS